MTQNIDIESVIESIFFVSKDPVSIEQINDTLHDMGIEIDKKDLRKIVNNLFDKWQQKNHEIGRGINLIALGDGYIFASNPNNAFIVEKMVQEKPLQLSKSQIEILSIIAYRQPLTRVDIDEIRGVDSSTQIKKLLQYKLIKILGKSEALGKPLLYGTSKYFLEFFSLTSLNDLPSLKQYETLGNEEPKTNGEIAEKFSIKDLFENNNTAIFSEKLNRLSEDALKSLDDALLHLENIQPKKEFNE